MWVGCGVLYAARSIGGQSRVCATCGACAGLALHAGSGTGLDQAVLEPVHRASLAGYCKQDVPHAGPLCHMLHLQLVQPMCHKEHVSALGLTMYAAGPGAACSSGGPG